MSEGSIRVSKLDYMALAGTVFRLYKKYFYEAVILGFIVTVPNLIENLFFKPYPSETSYFLARTGIYLFINLLFSTPLIAAFIWYLNKCENKNPVRLLDAVKGSANRFSSLFLVEFVVTIITLFGLLFLIIPGIIWGLTYSQALTYTLLEKKGLRESLEASKKLTSGYIFAILKLNIAVFIPLFIIGIIFNLIISNLLVEAKSMIGLMPGVFTFGLTPIITFVLWRELNRIKTSKTV